MTSTVFIPKAGSMSLAAHLGIRHQHIRAVDLPAPRRAVLRDPYGWTESFGRHLARWADESSWAAEAWAVVRGNLWDLDQVRHRIPPFVRNRCRVTSEGDGWPTPRSEGFYGPLVWTGEPTAWGAHMRWMCFDRHRFLIDQWIRWEEIEALPVWLNRSIA